ncbi:hypothetical protein D9613_008990 [Agrocybe pediades]|uniref:Uncharacterized protein n=1 Tax=Agrocybe pediades TaxID=84607 RepID=A0A8H4R444_9AGAR|nr:hypothetical protein D9613_008990 [Agrocybe pediades]
MPSNAAVPSSNALPDPNWRMPKRPRIYPHTQTRVFGFALSIEQQVAIADQFNLKPNAKSLARATAGRCQLVKMVPPEWQNVTTVVWKGDEADDTAVRVSCLFHNSNVTQEEVDNLPNRDSIKKVWEIIGCDHEGPRWYKYTRV